MIIVFCLCGSLALGYAVYLWDPVEIFLDSKASHPLKTFWMRLFLGLRIQKMRVALPAGMGILAGVVRAGGSLMQGLEVLAREGPEPLRRETARILTENRSGMDLDRSLSALALRYPFAEMQLAAAGIQLSRQTGSDLGEVLDRVVALARSELEMSQKIRSLSAQGIMSAWVMALMPVGMFFLLGAVDSMYMDPLFIHPVGKSLLMLCLAWEAIGILWIFQIIKGVGK